jgi:hypothetical protein
MLDISLLGAAFRFHTASVGLSRSLGFAAVSFAVQPSR